jgi:glutamyl-tRNA reductase
MEVYRDIQALEFCLQWICGLLSPVVGETEIQGQFKQALTEQLDHLDSHLKKILLFVLKKSKEIRKHCLQGVSQGSYGHWVRKILSQESGPVLLVGAGQLATSLLPWIPNLAALTNRDLRRAKALLGLKSKVKHASVWEWFDWEQWMQANHLVFCVPGFAVDSENFWAFAQAWRLAHPQGWVIDLAEPPCFPSGFPGNYVDLKAAFRDLEHMRNRLQLSVSEAKQVIYQEALHYASTWQWVMPHTLMDIAPLIV